MKKLSLLFFTMFTSVVFSCAFALFYIFSEPKIEEIIFSIQNKTGQVTTDVFISNLIPFLIALFLSLIFLLILFQVCKRKNVIKTFVLFLLLVNLCTVLYVYKSLGVEDYLFSDNSSFFQQNYVNISNDKIAFPVKKKNIIRIIAESMEVAYSDKTIGGAENSNLIPELSNLALINQSFSNRNDLLNGAFVPYGATWTMGAIFAQETGLSLETNIKFASDNESNTFFNNVNSFGKILKSKGYTNYVMRGSDTSFANANDFYNIHGDYVILDYIYAKQHNLIPQDYSVWWGYEDEKLFEFAKAKLLEISKSEEPYNFTIVTADTHSSDGYMCRLCKHEYELQYKNVISCSSRQIANFVDWIQQQEFYKDTVVVITGDHLTMDKRYVSSIPNKEYERKTYVNFINSSKENLSTNYRLYSVFDLFPTMLSAMGASIEGDKLGFGVDLYSDKVTLAEKYGYKKFNDLIKGVDNLTDSEEIEKDPNDILVEKIMNAKNTEEFFNIYQQFNSSSQYISFLVSQGDIKPLLKQESIINGLKSLGLDVSSGIKDSQPSILAIYGGGSVYDFEMNNNSFIQADKVINGHTIHLLATNDSRLSSIRIQTDELSRQCNGLNFMVFDLVINNGVFSICLE